MVRGQIVRAHAGLDEPKLFVIVSNNLRNQNLGDALGVRLTTSRKPPIPSVVEIPAGESVNGRAVCDDIGPIYIEDVIATIGALSPRTMVAIDRGLRAALALD